MTAPQFSQQFPGQQQFPQQGQQFPSQQFPQQGQQTQQVVREFERPATSTGFAHSLMPDYIKLPEFEGWYAVLHMKGITSVPVNGQNKEALSCDIFLINPNDPNTAQRHDGQSVLNLRIIGLARRLMEQGYSAAAGVVARGEAKGGNQPPVQLNEIESQDWNDYLFNVAVEYGWTGDSAAEQAASPSPAPDQGQAPAPAANPAPAQGQQAQAPAQGQAPAGPPAGGNPLG